MNFNIITINPNFFKSPLKNGLIYKALKKKIININIINLFNFIYNNNNYEDKVYGGGAGLLFKPEPLFLSISSIKKNNYNTFVIYLSPQGQIINNNLINKLLNYNSLILICGRYNGIDQRIIDNYVDIEISIGDYVISCGEISSLVLIDVLIRKIPGVLNNIKSLKSDSFNYINNKLLGYPNYTRPRIFNNLSIPKVLLSGNHKKIFLWRFKMSFIKTLFIKPYLLKSLFLINKNK